MYPDSYCANRGGMFLRDVPAEEIPPCKEPGIIGVSDVDGDGLLSGLCGLANPDPGALYSARYQG